MHCVICLNRLPEDTTSTDTTLSYLSRWRAHTKCLHDSVVFAPVPSQVSQIADLTQQLNLNSLYPVTEWLSMSSRLKALGVMKMPTSKWKWESIETSENGDDVSKTSQNSELLGKRGFGGFVSIRERGFNLDLFDLLKTNYGLTHPSLASVQKVCASQVKSPNLEIVHSEVNHRIQEIRQWLENVTQNYDRLTLPDQMIQCIRKFNKGEIFRKPDPNRDKILIAGQSKILWGIQREFIFRLDFWK